MGGEPFSLGGGQIWQEQRDLQLGLGGSVKLKDVKAIYEILGLIIHEQRQVGVGPGIWAGDSRSMEGQSRQTEAQEEARKVKDLKGFGVE